ncbi:MAG TPA: hypothetical protein DD435_08575 [Cyanobacteria bacterium UBA8530]|nr:hypothetical protein [Cyanobacteria bacterium UBA8530]
MTLEELLRARLSRNQRMRAFGSTLVLFAGLAGYFLAVPKWNEYQDAKIRLSELESKLPAIPLKEADVKAKLDEVKGINAEALAKRDHYPVAENISTMLIELEHLATERNIELDSFMPTRLTPLESESPSPGAKTVQKSLSPFNIQEQSIELEAAGSFLDFLGLLRDVEAFRHPLSINKLSIVPYKSTNASESLEVGATVIQPDRVGLKLILSAFLIEKTPQMAPMDEAYSRWLPQAQLRAGVANPFKKLIPDPTPKPILPDIPVMPAAPDPIEAWHLEGILMGPGKTAIVSDGTTNRTLQPGDRLEEWKVWSIDGKAITFLKNGKTRLMQFPALQLPPGSFVGK